MEIVCIFGKILRGIAVDAEDNIFVANYNNKSIDKVSLNNGKVSITQNAIEAKFRVPKGIVYNPSNKLFYITDRENKAIRTMTVDGNVNTLCKYSVCINAIAGEGKLYVSTNTNIGSAKGELITKGGKQMNISVIGCNRLAFNTSLILGCVSHYEIPGISEMVKDTLRPKAVAFAIDSSQSVDYEEFAKIKQALDELISELQPGTMVLVENFSLLSRTEMPWTQITEDNRGEISSTINRISKMDSSTQTGQAVKKIDSYLNQFPLRAKYVLILTDGRPTDDFNSYKSILKNKKDTTTICLGYGDIKLDILKELASPKQAYQSSNIDNVLKVIRDSYVNVFKHVSLALDLESASTDFSFSKATNLVFKVKIHNQSEKKISSNSKLNIDEITRKKKFFNPAVISVGEIDASRSKEIIVELTILNRNPNYIPKFLVMVLSDPDLGKQEYKFALQPALFTGDIFAMLKGVTETINILFVGPIGVGKSTLINSMTAVLMNNKAVFKLVKTCAGEVHCTLMMDNYNIGDLLDKSGLKISFTDTIGMDRKQVCDANQVCNGKWEKGFLKALVDGLIPLRDVAAQLPSRDDLLENKAPKMHAVVFVISADLYNAPKDEKTYIQNRIRELNSEATAAGLNPMYVVTHFEFDDLPIEKQDEIKEDLKKLLGSSTENTIFGSFMSEDDEWTFESQLGSLQVLKNTIETAKIYIKSQKSRN